MIERAKCINGHYHDMEGGLWNPESGCFVCKAEIVEINGKPYTSKKTKKASEYGSAEDTGSGNVPEERRGTETTVSTKPSVGRDRGRTSKKTE